MKLPSKDALKTSAYTVVWSAFILIGAFSAMALRGDIHLSQDAEHFLGSGLAVFTLIVLFSIVYKANKVR